MSLSSLMPGPVTEVMHDTVVIDPCRWLEDRASAATEHWIADQKVRHDNYFREIQGFDVLRARVSDYLNVESLDQPTKAAERVFYRRRQKDQQQACICMKDGIDGHEQVLVDPAILGPFASVAIHRISDDGSLLAYELKGKGSDAKAIHFVDTSTGQKLSDHLPTGHSRGLAFTRDKSGFIYCHDSDPDDAEHKICLHLFGNASEHDHVLFRVIRTPQSRLALISDGDCLGAIYLHEQGANSGIDFYLNHDYSQSNWIPLFIDKEMPYLPVLWHDRIFVLTRETTGADKIVELSHEGSEIRVVVRGDESRRLKFSFVGNKIYSRSTVDRKPTLQSWTFDGVFAGAIDIPIDGTVQVLPNLNPGSLSLFYSHESFTSPVRIFEYIPKTEESVCWTPDALATIPAEFSIQDVRYRSFDGTEIPMYLVMRKDLNSEEPHPAILTSYGGFGVSMTPKFSVLVTIMLELGAVFALPGIRGGSEFGRSWHDAARGRNRQVAIDDFIAAAEWLSKAGVTTPQRLAIFGGSNSGLLVGAAMTQRPELFRAVLCIAPLLDMVRYEQFDMAKKWIREYGTVTDPEDFASLYAYSPYHHIQQDINYPATLFVSGDSDDRCNPAHARKMTSRLQDLLAQRNPILIDYSRERGHSPVLPLSVRIDALTRRIAFICNEIGITLPRGEKS